MIKKYSLSTQTLITAFSGLLLYLFISLFFYIFPNLNHADDAVSHGPVLEETLKFIVVLLLIRFLNITPKIIMFIGVGFGLCEMLFRMTDRGIDSIILLFAHTLFGLVMAYFFYQVSKSSNRFTKYLRYSLAPLMPICVHLSYNLIIASLIK